MNQDNPFKAPETNLLTEEDDDGLGQKTKKALTNLRNDSTNVRCFGILWALGGLMMIVASVSFFGQTESIVPSLFFVAMGLIALCGTFVAITRPVWGRYLGMVLCGLLALNIFNFIIAGYTIVAVPALISILGFISFWRGKRLFGPNRYKHAQIKKALKLKKQS